MSWFSSFLTSSIGQKIIMSLTGLFLILFLTVHLAGNLQLLANDGGESFNTYAYMMTHNPLIKFISIGNFFFIGLHAVQGILLALKNRAAKGQKYTVQSSASSSFADLYAQVLIVYKNPIWTILYIVGLIALAFHLNHGFSSAFQTLGLNHKKYTPFIEGMGKLYSIAIPLGFAIIPIVIFLFR